MAIFGAVFGAVILVVGFVMVGSGGAEAFDSWSSERTAQRAQGWCEGRP
jgi:hypothetical protein